LLTQLYFKSKHFGKTKTQTSHI